MAADGPVRTCLACRKRGVKGELIKIADTPSGVVPDYMEKLPGRGAYACPAEACIKASLDEGRLSRAFRKKTRPPGYEEFRGLLINSIERRVKSLLGIARKSGLVRAGYDIAVEEAAKKPGGILVLATDVSGNTKRKLESDAPDAVKDAVSYSTRDELGQLLGSAPVAVLYVSDKGLATALAREFGRLNIFNRG